MNVFKVSVVWGVSIFTVWMFCFSNKNLEGNVYTNSYYEGFAGVIATLIGA